MRIIYMHHAERAIGPNHFDPILRQEEDITERGIKEVRVIAEQMQERTKNNILHIKAIVSSPYKRCMHTASIINEYLNVPIIEDPRFNEADSKEDMNIGTLWQRTIDGIQDIVDKYEDNDDILVVTSGVNLTGFICYFYNIDPKSNPPIAQGATCSPVNFIINK